MEMKILNEQETPLLSRKRITAEITYEGATPSRIKIIAELVKQVKAESKLIELRHVYAKFGDTRSKVIAHVYDNEENMKKIVKLGKKALEKIQKEVEAKAKAVEDAKKKAEEAVKAKAEAAEAAKAEAASDAKPEEVKEAE